MLNQQDLTKIQAKTPRKLTEAEQKDRLDAVVNRPHCGYGDIRPLPLGWRR